MPTVKGILDAATSNESIVAEGGGCCVSFQGLADDPTTMTEPTSPRPWFVRELGTRDLYRSPKTQMNHALMTTFMELIV